MQSATNPIVKDLVLVGGGHSHAIALRMYGMKPLSGLRITLITDISHTPYSGMLPGYVAGYYGFDECHIDLRRVAEFANIQLYIDRAIGLDLKRNKVICAHHPPVAFDVLSIDIGSTPTQGNVPGADKYAIPAKPVPQFLEQWHQLVEQVAKTPETPICISIVGGGAGGVELAMTMQRRLYQVLKTQGYSPKHIEIHLFHHGDALLSGHHHGVSRHVYNLLIKRGIQVHLQETVSEVLPHQVQCKSGLAVKCDYTFWVTNASAPNWIKESGLQTDSDGFILVQDTLQSCSHPHIFAAGDIATMVKHPRPKAGVFAVRQGQPLLENLRRILLKKPLKPYKPQKFYLSLIGTGNGEAIASWGRLYWQSSLLWRWKDYIDRQFMHRFSDLPSEGEEMSGGAGEQGRIADFPSENPMHCAGCGAKVGSSTLERVLQRIQTHHWVERDDILVGLGTPDDAAVVQVPTGQVMVQTIDYFRSLINDPYIFGQISTHHCLSDIFAMGATPQSALAVVSIPYGSEEKIEETLYQLLSGVLKALYPTQTQLIGGHTTQGSELAFGLTCNGLAAPHQLLRKGGMKPEQVLILTKAIGTGALFAANMRLEPKGRWIDHAIDSMLLSNYTASQVFLAHGATACTDITGFGLLGHLMEMVNASQVGVQLDLEAIPILEGVIEIVAKGITSSLQPQNLRASYSINNLSQASTASKYPLLFDPQTSGGLLAAVSSEQADSCLAALQESGYPDSQIVGRVIPAIEGCQPIRITGI